MPGSSGVVKELNYAKTGKMPIFDSPGCPHCRKVFASLRDPAITNALVILDLGEPSNYKVFLHEAEQRGETNAWPGHLPVLMTPTTVLRGPDMVVSYLNGNHAVTTTVHSATSAGGEPTTGGIGRHLFWIGLVDGVNPCAFALMIFVCIALRLAGRKGSDVFIAAAVFATAVGGTYLLFGWGLLVGMRHILLSPLVRAIVYGVSAIACCIGVLFSLAAIVKGGAPAGVPERWRKWLQRGINRNFRLGTGLVVIALAGVVASGVEAVCTGQVYLPALLALERERGASLAALGALLLYNLGFIIPLVAVALGAGLGFRTVQLQNWGATQVRWANTALAIVFIVFAVLLFHWSAEEFDWHRMQKARSAASAHPLSRGDRGVCLSNAPLNLNLASSQSPTLVLSSRSNALARIAAMLPGHTEEPILSQTMDGDLYWWFRNAGLSVDFWQPIMTQYSEGSIVTNLDLGMLCHEDAKARRIDGTMLGGEYIPSTKSSSHQVADHQVSYGEYVAALTWWFAWQREHGPAEYRRIPSSNLLEIVNQACGGCGEATGFRLVTSRFGFKCTPTSTTCGALPANVLPTAITWTAGGIDHAAVMVNAPCSNQAAFIRFPTGGQAVMLDQRVPPNAKAWVIGL